MRALAFVVSFLAFTTSITIQAQEKVLFRYNPPVGETLKYTVDMNMDMEGEASVVMDMNVVMTQTAQAKSESNTFTINGKFESVKVDMNAGMMMMSYDSKNPDESNPMTQKISERFKPILDAELILETNERAELVELSSTADLKNLIDVKQLFSPVHFPEKAVQVGESWDMEVVHEQLGMTLKYVYTYIGLQDGFHRLDAVLNAPTATGITISGSGFNLYAQQSFVLEKSEATSNIDAAGTNVTTRAVVQKL